MTKKLTEFYPELQGRPASEVALDLEKRQPSIPGELLRAFGKFGEIRLVPKALSSGPEGTIFYDSDDNHIYVGTE